MSTLDDKEFQQRMSRIETLISRVDGFSDSAARDVASELLQAVMELHGAGIERMLDIAWEKGEVGQEIIDEFTQDDLLNSLLLLHGLHPVDLETRVTQALDKVRPYLGTHGGNVELLSLDEGLVRLRLQGSCNGCASSEMTLKLAIEEAMQEFAPDIAGMEVEGVVKPPPPPLSSFIPLTAVGGARPQPADGNGQKEGSRSGKWETVDGVSSLKEGSVRVIEVSGTPVLFCRLGDSFYAYGNMCPNCNELLGRAKIAATTLTCVSCGNGYDIMRAGRCLDRPDLHLEPYPLLMDGARVKIALPTRLATT